MPRSGRNALTLLELVIVLVILVGVAGVVVPLLPNMSGRTHTSAAAANLAEIRKWIQDFVITDPRGSYPDGWDSLLTTAGTVPSYVLASGDFDVVEVDPYLAKLTSAGITQVANFVDGATNATFHPYGVATADSPTFTTLVNGKKIVTLNSDAKVRLGLTADGVYAVFGLGRTSGMIGKSMTEAPVSFPDRADENPTLVYNRFMVVFEVTPTRVARATLAGVYAPHQAGLTTGGEHLQEYFRIVEQSK